MVDELERSSCQSQQQAPECEGDGTRRDVDLVSLRSEIASLESLKAQLERGLRSCRISGEGIDSHLRAPGLQCE